MPRHITPSLEATKKRKNHMSKWKLQNGATWHSSPPSSLLPLTFLRPIKEGLGFGCWCGGEKWKITWVKLVWETSEECSVVSQLIGYAVSVMHYLRESPLYQLYSLACNKSVFLVLCTVFLVVCCVEYEPIYFPHLESLTKFLSSQWSSRGFLRRSGISWRVYEVFIGAFLRFSGGYSVLS